MAKLRGPIPLLSDDRLLLASALVWRAEGAQRCRHRRGRRPDLIISVKACDGELVESVSRGWGVKLSVTRANCARDAAVSGLNSKDLVWRTEAAGQRATRIIKAYNDAGLLGRERTVKLKRLKNCPNLPALGRGRLE